MSVTPFSQFLLLCFYSFICSYLFVTWTLNTLKKAIRCAPYFRYGLFVQVLCYWAKIIYVFSYDGSVHTGKKIGAPTTATLAAQERIREKTMPWYFILCMQAFRATLSGIESTQLLSFTVLSLSFAQSLIITWSLRI